MKYKAMSAALALAVLATPFSMAATPASVKTAPAKNKVAVVQPVMKAVPKVPAAVKTPTPAPVLESLLEGTATSPLWQGMDKILVNHQVEGGAEFVLIDVSTKKTDIVVGSDKNATEATLSADGKNAAYVNDNGDIFLLDLAARSEVKVTSDADPKMELQFSKDGSKLYFLSGDKVDTINVITLSDKKQTKLLADKVPYKSDLSVTADGKKLIYTVTNPGTTNEADGSFAVDTKNTDPQLFALTVAPDAKPVQLTKDTENKYASKVLDDGSLIYISVNADVAGSAPALKKISADGKSTAVLAKGLYALQVVVNAEGTLTLLGLNDGGEKGLYTVTSDGKATFVGAVDKKSLTLVPAADAKKMALTVSTEGGEKVVVLDNGKLINLTK